MIAPSQLTLLLSARLDPRFLRTGGGISLVSVYFLKVKASQTFEAGASISIDLLTKSFGIG
jgi:hypothetical protein